MGLDNPLHILIFVVVLLLVFGAKRLPEIGKSLGEGMRGFKESIGGSGGSGHTEILTPPASTAPAPGPASVPAAEAPVVPPPAPPPAPTADHS